MILFLSIDNNNINLSRETQRINNHEWKRTRKEQWEMAWALKERREKQSSYEENQKVFEFERFVPLFPKKHNQGPWMLQYDPWQWSIRNFN